MINFLSFLIAWFKDKTDWLEGILSFKEMFYLKNNAFAIFTFVPTISCLQLLLPSGEGGFRDFYQD